MLKWSFYSLWYQIWLLILKLFLIKFFPHRTPLLCKFLSFFLSTFYFLVNILFNLYKSYFLRSNSTRHYLSGLLDAQHQNMFVIPFLTNFWICDRLFFVRSRLVYICHNTSYATLEYGFSFLIILFKQSTKFLFYSTCCRGKELLISELQHLLEQNKE